MAEIVLEKFLNSKACDVGEKTPAGWAAWEIQMPSSVRADLLRDLILKDISAGFIKITICVESAKDLETAKRVIAKLDVPVDLLGTRDMKDIVELRLLADFLD